MEKPRHPPITIGRGLCSIKTRTVVSYPALALNSPSLDHDREQSKSSGTSPKDFRTTA
jgi:hypothetical protein